ncbi:MAG: hypothetical protein ABL974_13825 [Prosthecobacter sp.]
MSAATKTFSRILASICHRLDKDVPATTRDAARFAEYVTAATKLVWEFYPWPDALALTTESVTTHPTLTGARYIPKVTNSRTIGTLNGVYSANPLADPNARQLTVTKRADGYYLPAGSSETTVWLDYRPAPPEYTSELHVIANEYAVGDLAWDKDNTGHVYKAIDDAPEDTALTNTDFWVQVPVLACLAEPIIAGVIGAHNASEGNHGTARVKLEYMLEMIEHEITLLTNQEAQ